MFALNYLSAKFTFIEKFSTPNVKHAGTGDCTDRWHSENHFFE
jgi:hypothetical protein